MEKKFKINYDGKIEILSEKELKTLLELNLNDLGIFKFYSEIKIKKIN